MKRLTNLREVARKKIFSYVKMGLIIHLPNEVNHYASTHVGEITCRKSSKHNVDDDTYSNVYSYNTLINVWGDETSYNERYASGDQGIAYRVIMDFDVETDTYPTNPQTLIYAKYKTFLHSYTDDI